jgi:hypothetical protein
MKFKYFSLLIIAAVIIIPIATHAALVDKLSGRILLQVQQRGEAWFVHPPTQKKYYLGNPGLMLDTMKKIGQGINNESIGYIPVGLLELNAPITDTDGDGLGDNMEVALNTDVDNKDSDGDGYDDYTEVKNGYNPLGEGVVYRENEYNEKVLGNILIQVENHGEAWYYNPLDRKRYYLGRPEQALEVVRSFGLGISDADLDKIESFEQVVLAPNVKECGRAEMFLQDKQEEYTQVTTCFLEAFKTCSKATMLTSALGTDYLYEIIGTEGEKCMIKEKYILTGPDSQDLLDKEMVCTYNQARGQQHFEEISNKVISYKSSDLAWEKCEGELAEKLQR